MTGWIQTVTAAARWRAVLLLLGVAWLADGVAYGQVPEGTPPRTWSPEAAEALVAYRAGDYEAAQRLCKVLLAREGEGGGRRDAAVIEALCLLRMPARADRVEGRSRLAQLIQEDPALQDEPECNLAYGTAQMALSETATALEALESAAEGFAKQGLPARCADALIALAEAWARHSEWEMTPPRFGVKRPADSAEANATRRMQIEALRARIEALPDHAEALVRLDLVLSRHLMASGTAPDEGRAILARLAGAKELTPAAADAAMALAAEYEAGERWSDALPLYERIRSEWRGELAQRAAERVLEITRPQIVLEMPAAVRSGATVAVGLRVRGLAAVKVEVRQVDVEAWLGSARTRISEALLPESGSLRAARDLDTRAAVAYGWWQSDGLAQTLDFTAEPGAYVVIVKGEVPGKRVETVKRLVLISDLAALCCVGSGEVAVWAAHESAGEEVTAKFWMNRSFAPTEVKLEGNVARFPLPNEARVMREKGWVCLVRSGEQLAVCRGHLASGGEAGASGPQVALLAGPPEPAIGDVLDVAGFVLPGAWGAAELPAGARLELQIVDTLDKVQYATDVDLLAGGAFATRVPISVGLAGKHLRVFARYRGQAVENVLGRAVVSVGRENATQFRVRVDVPDWLPAGSAFLRGVVRAEYPWGTAPVRTEGRCTFRAVHLPASATNDEPVLGVGTEIKGRLDAHGRMPFEISLAESGLGSGPMAVDVDATVSNWEGRIGTGHAEVLLSQERPYAWLTHQPAAPAAGQDLRFRLGWSSPGGLAVARTPEIEIRRAGTEVAHLRLYPGVKGFASESWRPMEAGAYEVVTALATVGAEPLRLSKVVEVGAAAATQSAPARPRCGAHFAEQDGRAAVHVALEGEWASPLLVLVAGGDPLAARSVASLHGGANVIVPLPEEAPRAGLRAMVVGSDPGGFDVLCAEDVAPDPQRALELKLSGPDADVWPGTTVKVRAACHASGEAPQAITLAARLTSASTTGYVDPRLGSRSEASAPGAGALELASSTRQPVASIPTEKGEESTEGPSDYLWAILREGETLWCTSRAMEGDDVELAVPVPTNPGLYRLAVLIRTPEGGIATDAVILDARRGIQIAVDSPGRLMLGDQSFVAAQVGNGFAVPIEVRMRWQVGDGLHVDRVRIEGDGQEPVQAAASGPVTVTVPAGGRIWLRGDVEAARVGAGRVAVHVEARGVAQDAEGGYEVLSAEVLPEPNANVCIKRTVSVWTRVAPEAETNDEHEHEKSRWRWVALAVGERLLPGQFVQVRDELTLRDAQPELTWTLRVPATCRGVRGADRGSGSRDGRPAEPDDTLVYKLPRAAAGAHAHEWYLAVVRPGACVLPAPGLRAGETALSVAVDPPETRLIVAEGQ